MKVKDLIKDKNYDCVEVRMTLPGGGSALLGMAKSEGGHLVPLDDDTYEDIEREEVVSHEEFANLAKGIQHGLTVTTQGEWT